MGGKYSRNFHPVGICYCDDVVDGIGGINNNTFATFLVAKQIDKVDHLLGSSVTNCEVAARQQLAKIDIAGILHVRHTMS